MPASFLRAPFAHSSLRSRLLQLVAAAVLPLALFAVGAVVWLAEAKRADFQRSMSDVVRALSSAVDGELQRSVALAQAMTASQELASGDLLGMYLFAREVLARQPHWASIALSAPDGRYLFNTRRPFGGELPATSADAPAVRAAAASGQPVIGKLVVGSVSREPLFGIHAPVMSGGTARFVVSVVVLPSAMREVLQRQAIPADATVAVLDPSRMVVARSRQHEQFVGSPATASLQALMSSGPEGWGTPRTLDGRPTYAAYSTSPVTGWSVVIGLPFDAVGASQRQAYAVLLLGLALSAALGGAGALWLSRGIVAPIEALHQAARGIEAGREVHVPPTALPELQAVGDTLAATSRSVRETQRLRSQVLLAEQEARRLAEQASREKDEFLAMLSHELRNPLAAITNAFELMRRLPPGAPQAGRMHAIVERQMAHLTYLINDLMDVSRVVSGKIVLEAAPVDLAACAREALAALQQAGTTAAHDVRLDATPAWVEGDAERLQQVISNLVSNAAKYSPAGTAITVRVRPTGSDAVLEVSDQGMGMSAETLAHVFDLFFQAGISADRAQGGLGVGLTLTRRLVELHGGRIEAHSEGQGRGSRFTMTLPLRAAQPGAPAALPADGTGAQAPKRVLVVDDNHDNAESLAELLRLEGHEVQLAHDGGQAVQAALEWRPDIVLLDIGLPVMSGHEVCERLRAEPAGRAMRIVALTGWGQQEDVARSAAAGFDAHLTKPVEMEALMQALEGTGLPAG